MSRIPKRISLAGQAIDILRDDLCSGRWRELLPSEKVLAEEMRVSRRTIRTALDTLKRDGLISSAQGRRRRILDRLGPRRRLSQKSVGWLSPVPWHSVWPSFVYRFNKLQGHLQGVNFDLLFRVDPTRRNRRGLRLGDALQSLVRETEAGCWVLNKAPEEVQRWFFQQRIPTLVFGTTYEGIQLPCLDWDFRAIARHAVGVLARRGHRRIVLIMPRTYAVGNISMEKGFREALEANRLSAAEPLVIRHNGTAESICKAVNSTFGGQRPPTALLVPDPHHVLTIISQLLVRGLRLPQDVSLIALEFDQYLDYLAFSVAHYADDLDAFAGHMARLATTLAVNGVLPPKKSLIIPQFEPGDTLGQAPP